MAERCIGQNAMAEIENKRPRRKRGYDRIDRAVQRRASDQECQRIEIALNGPPRLNFGAREAKLNGPIEPDCVDRDGIKIASKLRAGARSTKRLLA